MGHIIKSPCLTFLAKFQLQHHIQFAVEWDEYLILFPIFLNGAPSLQTAMPLYMHSSVTCRTENVNHWLVIHQIVPHKLIAVACNEKKEWRCHRIIVGANKKQNYLHKPLQWSIYIATKKGLRCISMITLEENINRIL